MCASCGQTSIVGRRGTGPQNNLFCSSIGSEIKTGINSGIYLIVKNKTQ
nr:MAG TPA: NUDIX domain protein [Caudoviricetes sp.]